MSAADELAIPPDVEASAAVYSVIHSVEALSETLAVEDARKALTGKDAGELEAAVSTLMRIVAEIDNEPR